MPNVLISGPAGASKSLLAREFLARAPGLAVAADFQALYAALLLLQRGPDGRYPLRNRQLLPMTEYVRQAVITGATNRDIQVVATNSDGDPARRARMLERLGPDAVETVVDPGRDVVTARLLDAATNELSEECELALDRWYGRL